MKSFLVINEAAGSLSGDQDGVTATAILDAFHQAGLAVQLWIAPRQELDRTLQAAVREHPDTIFVGGGDGTVSAAAALLADTNIALGVVPLGTLNHFAKDLGLPPDWREAISRLAHGSLRDVDVGEVNGRVFINNCSLGSYAEAVRKRDALRRRHGHGKGRAMVVASLAVFRQLRRMRLSLEVEGRVRRLRTPFLVVANNRYAGRVLDGNLRPRLDEGRLWIYSTHAFRRFAIVRLIWQSLRREIDSADALERTETTAATVTDIRTGVPTALDGELVDLNPPFRFRIRPAALRVLVPGLEPTMAEADPHEASHVLVGSSHAAP